MKKLSFLSLLFVLFIASCGPKPEEQVKEFAVKFGDFVNTNQKDSIHEYYPGFELTDSLNRVPVGNIIVEQGEDKENFLVKYSPEVSIIVSLSKNGEIYVEQSNGLIVIDPKGSDLMKKANLWDDDLSDAELKKLAVEQLRKDSINNMSAGLTFQMFCKPEKVEDTYLQSFLKLKQIKANLEEIGFLETGTQKKIEKAYDWTPENPTYYTKIITSFSKSVGENITTVTIEGSDFGVGEAQIDFPKAKDVLEFKSTVTGKLRDNRIHYWALDIIYKEKSVSISAAGGE